MLTRNREFEPQVNGPETNKLAASLRSPRTISAPTALLPLRLFLGVSFLAAGFDKLFDPQFFDPNAPRYIGNQLAGFAQQSPLGGFLTSVAVPNATLFGAMVLAGELAIGLGTLVGLFSRTAAFFGFILSLTLWLTSSWQVAPFFLGSDLPYAIAWLVLAIGGAHPVWSLDGQRLKYLARMEQNQPLAEEYGSKTALSANAPALSAAEEVEQSGLARRRFIAVAGATVLTGAVTGVAWMNSLAEAGDKISPAADTTATPAPATNTSAQATSTPLPTTAAPTQSQPSTIAGGQPSTNPTSAAPAPTTAAATATPKPQPTTAAAVKGPVLASLNSIPAGSAVSIAIPGTNDPAFVVHEADGSVKAFSAICTHEGCVISFSKSAKVFACPCHGAQYDIKTGAVLRGPARRALASYKVQVDGSGNIIYVQS